MSNGPIAIGMLASLWGPSEDMLGLRDGLAALGIHQNEQVALGVRSASGDISRLDTMVRELLRDGAQILYASGWAALQAAQRVTSTIPIVFTAWRIPNGAALGTNVTGATPAFSEVPPKALQVFQSLLPTLKRVLVPYDANDPELVQPLQALRAAALRLEVDLIERPVRSQEEARQAIMETRLGDVDGILPVGGRLNIAGYALQAGLQQRIPTLFSRAWMADYGGLASYGPSWYGLGRRSARLLAAIVRGDKPENLPMEVTE